MVFGLGQRSKKFQICEVPRCSMLAASGLQNQEGCFLPIPKAGSACEHLSPRFRSTMLTSWEERGRALRWHSAWAGGSCRKGSEAQREARRWLCWGRKAVALRCFGSSLLIEPFTLPLRNRYFESTLYMTLIQTSLDISPHLPAHT